MTNDNDIAFQELASAVQEIDRLKSDNARLAAAVRAEFKKTGNTHTECTCELCKVMDGNSTALCDLLAPTIQLLQSLPKFDFLFPGEMWQKIQDELARLRAVVGEKGKI
jgi:hypothetical protein